MLRDVLLILSGIRRLPAGAGIEIYIGRFKSRIFFSGRIRSVRSYGCGKLGDIAKGAIQTTGSRSVFATVGGA
jgi:hypothetical protein